MRVLSHRFTTKEKVGAALLILALLGLAYFQFVDRPVRRALEEAAAQRDALLGDINIANAQVNRFRLMAEELTGAESRSGRMPSYNASKEEIAMLNGILESARQYDVSFADVKRSGDLIRREFSLQFSVGSFGEAKAVIERLARGEIRCLIENIVYSSAASRGITVRVTGTFYETMVGGVPDAGLPQDTD